MIETNELLTQLDGLASLAGPIEGLTVDRTSLTNLDGLSGITSVGGGSVTINNNAWLLNLSGLSNVSGPIGMFLTIDENRSLTGIELGSCDGVENSVQISINPDLCQSRVDAFIESCSCDTLDGGCWVSSNNEDC